MWLLDTNVLSELRRRDRTHPNVAAWADALHPQDLFLSVITILEIEAGALMIARRDKTQGAILRAWIDNRVLTAFEGRVLPIDTKIAQLCASLHVPDPRAERDAFDRRDGSGSPAAHRHPQRRRFQAYGRRSLQSLGEFNGPALRRYAEPIKLKDALSKCPR